MAIRLYKLNPLAVIDKYTRSGILIFLWSWTSKMPPRSFATYALGSGLISSPKIANLIKNRWQLKS